MDTAVIPKEPTVRRWVEGSTALSFYFISTNEHIDCLVKQKWWCEEWRNLSTIYCIRNTVLQSLFVYVRISLFKWKLFIEKIPFRILSINQIFFFSPVPFFQLLLSNNCIINILKCFIINKMIAIITTCPSV